MTGLGNYGLVAALGLLGLSFILCLFANPGRRKIFLGAGMCFIGAACLVLWCCGLLALAFYLNDFSNKYVAGHSSLATPWYYRLSAFWAGQEGSCLLWLVLIMASICAVCGQVLKSGFDVQRRIFLVSAVISAFLLAMTIFLNNPFARSSVPVTDGAGLNPLLQDWAMIIHPPLLFLGYAFLAVVFILVSCRGSEELTGPLIARWSRLASAMLTAGIAFGALWAYDELGWGGYWGWDPVENASLLPWLASFALIHFVPKNITRIDRPAVIFAGIGFGSTILASYLTRSGVVTSVHGFADGTLSWVWLIPLGLVVLSTVFRLRKISVPQTPSSRLILVTGLLFLVIALAVLTGTLWPVLGKLFIQSPQPLRPEFYNSMAGTLGLALLFTLTLCALRRLSPKQRRESLISTATVSSVACFGIWYLFDVNEPGRLIAVFLLAANMCIPLIELLWYRRKMIANLPRNLAHLGLVVLAAGLTASMVQPPTTPLILHKGETKNIGTMQVKLEKVRLEIPAKDQFDIIADLVIRTGRRTIDLHPKHTIWSDNRRRVDIDFHPGLIRDFYATLDDFDESHSAMITVRQNWLVSWVWAGSSFILVASLLSGFKRRTHA